MITSPLEMAVKAVVAAVRPSLYVNFARSSDSTRVIKGMGDNMLPFG